MGKFSLLLLFVAICMYMNVVHAGVLDFLTGKGNTSEDDGVDERDVVILTDENFDAITKSGSWMIEFYAPWCGHCKQLKPIYAAAAMEAKPMGLYFGKIDMTQEKDLKTRFDIRSFPQIKFLRDGGDVRDYKGPRTLAGFLTFAKDLQLPAVAEYDNVDEHKKALFSQEVTFVFVGDETSKERDAFNTLAFQLQGMYKFHAMDNTALVESVFDGIKIPREQNFVVMACEAGLYPIYTGSFDTIELREFVNKNSLPLLSLLSGQNFDEITASEDGRKAIIIAFYPSWNQIYEYRNSLLQIAKNYPDYIFTLIDGEKYSRYLTQFNIESYNLPQIFVLDSENEQYYKEKGNNKYEYAEDIVEFVQKIINNEIEAIDIHAWYTPTKYLRKFEKFMAQFNETQIMIGAVSVSVVFSAIMCLGIYISEKNVKKTADENDTKNKRKKRKAE